VALLSCLTQMVMSAQRFDLSGVPKARRLKEGIRHARRAAALLLCPATYNLARA